MKICIYKFYIPLMILVLLMMSGTVWSQDDRTVGLLVNDDPHAGYNLFAPYRSFSTFLIDNDGRLINQWIEPDRLSPGAPVYLTENGTLLKACFTDESYTNVGGGAGRGGLIREYDWDGNLIWQYKCESYHTLQHHDFRLLPNGNLLLMVYEFIPMTAIEAEDQLGYTGSLISIWNDGSKIGFQSEKIIEVKPDYKNWNPDLNSLEDGQGGTVVWEWHYLDHVIQDEVPGAANYGTVADHPELFDINLPQPRFNSIDYSPDLDQILVSNSNANEIFVIDHGTTKAEAAGHTGGMYGKGGDILYRWGNPQNYDAPGIRIPAFQHTVRWLQSKPHYGYHLGDEGNFNILYFNNRGLPGVISAVDEFSPPLNSDGSYVQPAPGEAFGPEDLFWRYSDGFVNGDLPSSPFISSTQRLPNGNTLVCSGRSGTFFEVTKTGTIVWKYVNPVYNASPTLPGSKPLDCQYLPYNGTPDPMQHMVFRVTRYAEDFKGFSRKDMSPGAPLELYPDEGLAKNMGDLKAVEQLNLPTRYALSQNYPNPFNPDTRIEFQLPEADYVELKIYNTLGKEIRTLAEDNFEAGYHGLKWNGTDNNRQSVPTGVYIYQIRAGNFTQVKKMMLLK